MKPIDDNKLDNALENERTALVEKTKVISEDAKLVENFNEYFEKIMKKLEKHEMLV